jgi:hypothetical protein
MTDEKKNKGDDSKGDWSFVAAHFILIGVLVGVLYGYRDAKVEVLSAALAAVVVALVAVRFDRIKKLTSKFVSYETRDVVKKADAATTRANKAADEAKKIAAEAKAESEQLRTLGALLSRLSLDVLSHTAVVGEFKWSEKTVLRNGLKAQLAALRVPKKEIAEADELFVSCLRFKLGWKVVDAARACRGAKADLTSNDPLGESARHVFDFPRKSPTTRELRKLVGEHVDATVEGLLADYEHLIETGEVRDPTLLDRDA